MRIIRSWHSDQSHFVHQTSGSTGRPKKIKISRDKIIYSAQATMKEIDPEASFKSSLLCLNTDFIGGAMVVYRALIYDHDLTIIGPSMDLMESIEANDSFDLISVAPIQFKKFDTAALNKFNTILIGGGPMPRLDITCTANIYSTFGMTETVSHIALRKLNEVLFTTTGDAIAGTNADGTLKIRGTITDNKWLNTNDLVTLHDSTTFEWHGRKDFVINSGGIKVNPETIEELLKEQLSGDFMISSLPDDTLGEKIILLSSDDEKTIDFSRLPKYSAPKEIHFNQTILKTDSDKIDRLRTKKCFEEKR
ncbi:AMP-binding protein [Ekhidna sp.]|uniref:AMP-binding protein n=1 Tax=Ekhidna sp. TaxID=2608089 RepID=UPI003B500784